VNESSHTVINEYGSNLQKSKHDPLTAIEAKNALHGCKKSEFFQLEDYMIKPGPSKSLPSILEEKEENHNTARAVSMSPTKGSQGAPEIDISSQEEIPHMGSQDIDWDLIQEEDGQKSEVDEVEIVNEKIRETNEEVNPVIMEVDKVANAVEIGITEISGLEGNQEQLNIWDKHVSALYVEAETGLKDNNSDWPEWKEVRQSKRIRDNGTSQVKVGDQAQNKMAADLEERGNCSSNQNSFAVLNNTNIVSLANMMGIHSESLYFEKIDLLKDLENARMKLNEHSNAVSEQTDNMEGDNLPLEDQSLLEWGSNESEDEPCFVVVSAKKSRSSKKKNKRKARDSKKQPLAGLDNSVGVEFKVSPRFNLRDRKIIKKVIR
jgi:hypothetical protein